MDSNANYKRNHKSQFGKVHMYICIPGLEMKVQRQHQQQHLLAHIWHQTFVCPPFTAGCKAMIKDAMVPKENIVTQQTVLCIKCYSLHNITQYAILTKADRQKTFSLFKWVKLCFLHPTSRAALHHVNTFRRPVKHINITNKLSFLLL